MQRTNDNGLVWAIRTALDPHLYADVARRLTDARLECRHPRPVAVVAPERVRLGTPSEWSLVVHLSRWDVREIRYCLSRGACGFMTETCTAEEIAQAILGAAFGRSNLPPDVLAEIAQVDTAGSELLDDGDRAILELAATGANQFEIAEALHWSERTIRRRLTLIRRRLGAMSTIEVVAIAASRGELWRRKLSDMALPSAGMTSVSVQTTDGAATRAAKPDMKSLSTGQPDGTG